MTKDQKNLLKAGAAVLAIVLIADAVKKNKRKVSPPGSISSLPGYTAPTQGPTAVKDRYNISSYPVITEPTYYEILPNTTDISGYFKG